MITFLFISFFILHPTAFLYEKWTCFNELPFITEYKRLCLLSIMLTYNVSEGCRRPLQSPPHPQAALSHFLSASLFVCPCSQGHAVPVCVPADACNARHGRFCLESFLGYSRDAFFPCHYSLRAERPKTLKREQQKALWKWEPFSRRLCPLCEALPSYANIFIACRCQHHCWLCMSAILNFAAKCFNCISYKYYIKVKYGIHDYLEVHSLL